MRKCIICNGELKKYKLDKLYYCPRDNYICADCNMSEDELAKLYDDDFWNGQSYTDYLADEKIIRRNFRRRIKKLKRYMPTGGYIYEIGCAYGLFLDECKKALNCKVGGVDVSHSALKYASNNLKLPVQEGDYLEHELKKKADIMCMWDTIEHLKEPGKFLRKMNADLTDNGIAVITTGDIGSLNARIRGRKWRQYQPPLHLQYFTKKSLTKLLARYGFRVLKVQYIWNQMSLNNALYIILCLHCKLEFLYKILVKLGIKKINVWINLHDYMCVTAQKVKNSK